MGRYRHERFPWLMARKAMAESGTGHNVAAIAYAERRERVLDRVGKRRPVCARLDSCRIMASAAGRRMRIS